MIRNKNTSKAIFIFLSLISLPLVSLGGHKPDSSSCNNAFQPRINILPVPAFGYSPETSTYIGAVALMTLHLHNDSMTRTSNAKAEFNYTWKKQYITDFGWEIYTKKEKFYYKGRLTFSRYPDLYYGIGENTPFNNEVNFDSRRINAEFNVLKSLNKNRYLGLVFRYNKYNILDLPSDVALKFSELYSSESEGIGFRFMTDKRNNLLNCTNGKYTDISFTANFPNTGINYYRLGIDLRYYKTFNNKHTLAMRYLSLFTLDGFPPFWDMALLGGDNQVRGYLLGRYRDRNLVTLQPEFRSVIYRRWGYALFGGISNLNNFIDKFDLQYLKANYGAGIRFMIDRKERTNLRLDYAKGNDGSDGFYISFGEAF